MPYRFKRCETIAESFKRIAGELIAKAHADLSCRSGQDREEGIHEVRKRLKELRALLRLVRGELGGDLYRNESMKCRDWGRYLAGARDASVAVATFRRVVSPEEIAEEYSVPFNLLATKWQKEESLLMEGGVPAPEVSTGLLDAAQRIPTWNTYPPHRFPEMGLKKIYRLGLVMLEKSIDDPADLHLHEWRKRVKDLRYQIQLLQDAWPEGLGPLETQFHRLSDLLGEDHDLAVLWQIIGNDRTCIPGARDRNRLYSRIGRRRSKLQDEAFRLGLLLYAEKPSAFTSRMKTYWKRWQAG